MGKRYSKFNKSVGAAIQRNRIKAGYKSARECAESLGLNPSTYTDYEQGKAMPSYERAWQLADAFNCTLDELGGRTSPEQRNYSDSDQEALNGYYESMNEVGRGALVETARLMSDGDAVRIEKDSAELADLPPEMERSA